MDTLSDFYDRVSMVHMEAHTPKREAIEQFIHAEKARLKDWSIRVKDEPHDPIVRLIASRGGELSSAAEKSLEIHSRQVMLERGEIDETAKTMIRRWIASL